jgi:hypothetical protein
MNLILYETRTDPFTFKSTGSKAIVKLNLQNTYSEKIQSVRAVVFLLND